MEKAMSLGKRRAATPSFLPLIKYDARTGVFSRIDREQRDGEWAANATDVTEGFQAIFDLAHVEIGWISYTGGAPDFKMVPLGGDIGERPSDKHKEGVRVRMKLQGETGSDLRELSSTSQAMWDALSELHDAYLEDVKKHPNKLPVVGVAELKQVRNLASTNYAPCFEIVSWVSPPAEFQSSPSPTPPRPKRKTAATDNLDEPVLL
jgi:hypothetical protein